MNSVGNVVAWLILGCLALVPEVRAEEVTLSDGDATAHSAEYFTPREKTRALVVLVATEPFAPKIIDSLRGLPAHIVSIQFSELPTDVGLSKLLRSAARFGETTKGCDTTRLGLVSLGRLCPLSVFATHGNPSLVRALVLVSPEVGESKIDPKRIHPWPAPRTRIVAPADSAAARRLGSLLASQNCDTHNARGTDDQALAAVRSVLVDALSQPVGLQAAVLGTVKGDPLELENANVAPRFISSLLRSGGAHRTVGDWRYRVVAGRAIPETAWELRLYRESDDKEAARGYEGAIKVTIGDHVVTFPILWRASGSPDEMVVKGIMDGEAAPVRATFWVGADSATCCLELRLESKSWKMDRAKLVAEFIPKKGTPARLPAVGAFEIRPFPYAVRRFDLKWPR